MWMKIKCPACQTESSSWLLETSYKGQHRCWKCKALFTIEVINGDVISCEPMSEEELARIKARQEAKKRGLDFEEEPAAPRPAEKPSQPFAYAKSSGEDRGADFAALARSSNQGLEFSSAEPASETPAAPVSRAPDAPVQVPFVWPKPDDVAEAPVEGTTCKIDSFNFGFIVVGGKQYNHDIDILPDGRVLEREPGKGRIGSHAITRSQLEPIVKVKPEVILIGTGVDSMAKLSGDAQAWQQRGTDCKILAMSSGDAVAEFNKLAAAGKRVAALIHITC